MLETILYMAFFLACVLLLMKMIENDDKNEAKEKERKRAYKLAKKKLEIESKRNKGD